jgi:beta-galactosidase
VGLLAVGLPLLSVAAQQYTTADLEQAAHSYELVPREFVTLDLDHRQMGVGGDDSWGARPHEWCTLHPRPYRYGFRLRPFLEEKETPVALGQQRLPIP